MLATGQKAAAFYGAASRVMDSSQGPHSGSLTQSRGAPRVAWEGDPPSTTAFGKELRTGEATASSHQNVSEGLGSVPSCPESPVAVLSLVCAVFMTQNMMGSWMWRSEAPDLRGPLLSGEPCVWLVVAWTACRSRLRAQSGHLMALVHASGTPGGVRRGRQSLFSEGVSEGSSGTGFPAVLGADFRAFVGGSPVQGGLIYKYLHQGVEVKSINEYMATKVILNGSAI